MARWIVQNSQFISTLLFEFIKHADMETEQIAITAVTRSTRWHVNEARTVS